MTRAIVTDIEGTTSSISFVKEVLFPYAARHLPGFLATHWDEPEVRQQIAALEDELGRPVRDAAEASAILRQWIGEDRKATPLKALQGMIWREGYEQGAYRAHVYPEVAACLGNWKRQGLDLYVYSSGSAAAQKLFFRYSDAGDLSGLFSGYFDTTAGPKREARSYRNIAAAIRHEAGDILFLSDITEELDAARAAGFRTVQLDRDGILENGRHTLVRSFDPIDPATA